MEEIKYVNNMNLFQESKENRNIPKEHKGKVIYITLLNFSQLYFQKHFFSMKKYAFCQHVQKWAFVSYRYADGNFSDAFYFLKHFDFFGYNSIFS